MGCNSLRECKICKEFKTLESFYKGRYKCIECFRKSVKKNYYKKRPLNKATRLFSLYGISIEIYNKLLEDQKGMCFLCETNKFPRALAVDHNHNNGEIRGLLCENCNKGLGMFGDNPELLDKAANYLRSTTH